MAGARVRITGTNLEEVLGTSPNGQDLQVVSPTELYVTAPPRGVGMSSLVSVVTSGGTSEPNPDVTFTWVAPPAVSELSLGYGPASGGTRVRVWGTGFTGLGGVTRVDFGVVPGTDVAVVSDNELHVTAPAHAPGFEHVRVTTPAGTSRTTWDDLFSFEGEVVPAGTSAVTAPLPGGVSARSDLYDVACPATGECFAVGSYTPSTARPLVERLSGGSWSPTELPLPPDARAGRQSAQLTHVNCPTVTFCAAVGSYDNGSMFGAPLLATWNGLAWSVTTVPMEPAYNGDDWVDFNGLDCTADRTCVAVGTTEAGYSALIVSYQLGTWSLVPSPPQAESSVLRDVDCIATECVAVGSVVLAGGESARPWVVRGRGLSWTGTAPRLPGDSDGGANLNAVSCAAVGSCVAVGGYWAIDDQFLPLSETLSAGTWTPASVPPVVTEAFYRVAGLRDVSCPAVDQCVAAGGYTEQHYDDRYTNRLVELPMVSHLGAGPARSDKVTMPNGDPVNAAAGLFDIACTTPGTCVGAGQYDLAQSRTRGLVANVWGGQARPGSQLLVPMDVRDAYLPALVPDSDTSAVAVGQYVTFDGTVRAYLVTGIPVGP